MIISGVSGVRAGWSEKGGLGGQGNGVAQSNGGGTLPGEYMTGNAPNPSAGIPSKHYHLYNWTDGSPYKAPKHYPGEY